MAETQRYPYFVVIALALLLCAQVHYTLASGADSIKADSAAGGSNTLGAAAGGGSFLGNRRNLRSVYGLGPRMLQISRSKIPIELDLLVENEDGDRSKRFDDYGHMRFGKRGGEEQFDDYGHMRFGRST